MAAALDLLVEVAGPGRLALVHANDSKDGCGSRRDRHETVGAGTLGPAAFAELLAHPTTAGVPVVVETPSEGSSGTGHARDIATLMELAGTATRKAGAGPHPPVRRQRRRPVCPPTTGDGVQG
jgi:deoxyribonuclease-4